DGDELVAIVPKTGNDGGEGRGSGGDGGRGVEMKLDDGAVVRAVENVLRHLFGARGAVAAVAGLDLPEDREVAGEGDHAVHAGIARRICRGEDRVAGLTEGLVNFPGGI